MCTYCGRIIEYGECDDEGEFLDEDDEVCEQESLDNKITDKEGGDIMKN